MSKHSLPTILAGNDKETPLPLIVASKWNFKLTYVVTEEEILYHVQEWIKGLLEKDDAAKIWNDMSVRSKYAEVSASTRKLPYVASNGKTYQMDFVNDEGLYLIAQNLRVTKSRPVLKEIKKYLAEAGAFVDLVRRKSDTVITSGAINLDDAVDAVIEAYRKQGKTDRWIAVRLTGKIKRAKFTAALKEAVYEVLNPRHYALATNDIYLGLWNRTAAKLKKEMGLTRKESLRDNQPTLALSYQAIAEDVCSQKLGNQEELSWNEARLIIKEVAALIGIQAQATSEYLNIDLATGKTLLSDGMLG